MAKSSLESVVNFDVLREALAADFASDKELFQAVVNAPFEHNKVASAFMFLGIVVLLQVNKKTKTIDRVALSDTELAKNTTEVSIVPFEQIKIPLDYADNIISQAVRKGEPQDTTDWKFLFAPALASKQARINQASAGIAYSAVYPLSARDGGALIYSYYQYQEAIDEAQQGFMSTYTSIVNQSLGG